MTESFRVVAIMAAFNEADIIGAVIGHLAENGVEVYLIDNRSTDDTVREAERWLGKGLIAIETFPSEAPGGEGPGPFRWGAILSRKEELARALDADWFIHHDADEVREGPWPRVTLGESIRVVDRLGYNCIDFQVLNFPPVDDSFRRGDDPRAYFRFYEEAAPCDRVQRKCWKKTEPIDLRAWGGHDVRFPGRRVFPIPFLLRHYPIRGQTHGLRKVFEERKSRFLPEERALDWHVQYDAFRDPSHNFVRDPARLLPYDPDRARLNLALDNLRTREDAERLQEATTHVRSLESAREAMAGENRHLRERVAELEVHTRGLEARRDELERHAKNLEARGAELDARTSELEKHAANLEALRGGLEARTVELERHARALEARRDELEQHATALETQVTRLQAEQERLTPQVKELESAKTAGEQAVRTLKAELAHRERTLGQVRTQLAQLEAEQERLTQQVRQSEATNAARKAEASELQHHLDLLLNSRSWKVTAPLRWLSAWSRSVAEKLAHLRETWYRTAYDALWLSSLTPSSVSVGPQANPQEAVRWIAPVRIEHRVKHPFWMHPPAQVTYRIRVAPSAVVWTHVALLPEVWGRNPGGVQFKVSISLAGKDRSVSRQRWSHPTRLWHHRRWIELRVSLRRFAHREIELTLSTAVPPGVSADYAWAIWGDPVILFRKPLRELVSLGRNRLRAYRVLGPLERLLRSHVPRLGHAHPFGPGGQRSRSELPEPFGGRGVRPKDQGAIPVTVSVVIPTKNGISEGFEHTLRAIHEQRGIGNIEVVIVDSGSSDKTLEVAKEYGAKLYELPPEEFNHGATRNHGAEQSSGQFLVFMTQDVIPATEDLFYEMARALLDDPELAGSSVRSVPRSDADIYACYESWYHSNFLFGDPLPVFGNLDMDRRSSLELRRLASLDNVCSMVKRDMWEQIKFEPMMYAEDLAFGLSCLKARRRIGLLPHRAVIHSHTRPASYYLSRHYVDRLVLLGLFKEDRPRWINSVTPDQLVTSVKELYLAIRAFARSLESGSRYDPVLVLRGLPPYLSTRRAVVPGGPDHDGESGLDEWFATLHFEDDRPRLNPCRPALEGKIDSILQFLGKRYPLVDGAELRALTGKAGAAVAGSMLGEFAFWAKHGGTWSSQLEELDGLLRAGMRRQR